MYANNLCRKMLPRLRAVRNFCSEKPESLVGGRKQVGFGHNGQPQYADLSNFPFPAIRFKEETPEIQALRGKEMGDWKMLSLQEKKALYRASFRQTFAEFQAPTGEWRTIVGVSIILCSIGIWLFILQQYLVDVKYPDSYSKEHGRAQMRRMLDLRTNPVTGLASEWDYEKMDWKTQGFFKKDNPFVDPETKKHYERQAISYAKN